MHSPLQSEFLPLEMCTFRLGSGVGFKKRRSWTKPVVIEMGILPEGRRCFAMENESDISSSVISPNSVQLLLMSWCCRTEPDSELLPRAGGLLMPAAAHNTSGAMGFCWQLQEEQGAVHNHSQSRFCFFSCLWAGCDQKTSAVQCPGKNCR